MTKTRMHHYIVNHLYHYNNGCSNAALISASKATISSRTFHQTLLINVRYNILCPGSRTIITLFYTLTETVFLLCTHQQIMLVKSCLLPVMARLQKSWDRLIGKAFFINIVALCF